MSTGSPLRTVEDLILRRKPAYTVPKPPAVAWSAAASPRRAWISRLALCAILLLQAALSLRLSNTVFQDEALYLYVGHEYLDHLFGGAQGVANNYADYFSGAPYLYPVLGAAADQAFGLVGARLLSLGFMLGITALIYSFTHRLFNVRSALCAAAAFSFLESTVTLGYFATYDAAAMFLLALATWIVIRTDRSSIFALLLAAPCCVLAFAVKYASGMYVPTVLVLAVLVSWPHDGPRRALSRGVALGTTMLVGLAAFLLFGGVLDGLRFSTTNRAAGTRSFLDVLNESAEFGGACFVIALIGAGFFVHRGGLNESPNALGTMPGRTWRVMFSGLLLATALLAPFYQAHLHTTISLHKHVGYGLMFAAPMAGVGISRMTGAHFRNPQYGIVALMTLLVLGMSQSEKVFAFWPDSTTLVRLLDTEVTPKGRYLSNVPEVPIYSLGDRLSSSKQWMSTFSLQDIGEVQAGHFDLIVLDGTQGASINRDIELDLKFNPHYRLRATLFFANVSMKGRYKVWVKVK